MYVPSQMLFWIYRTARHLLREKNTRDCLLVMIAQKLNAAWHNALLDHIVDGWIFFLAEHLSASLSGLQLKILIRRRHSCYDLLQGHRSRRLYALGRFQQLLVYV